MPYWDMPEALGKPVGNFPSFRGRNGELLPRGSTNRGLSTLARQVYGYSLAFLLTGEDRYLTYAKAGIDWINTKAKDPVYGGYYGELDVNGKPVNPLANKDLFDLASLGLAYGMYFNVTRDPAAEADLLAVRDLIFAKYYDAAQNRMKDSLTYDLDHGGGHRRQRGRHHQPPGAGHRDLAAERGAAERSRPAGRSSRATCAC